MKTTAAEGQTLLKIPEAAVRLGVSRATVYRLIEAGELSTVTIKTERSKVRAGVTRIPSGTIDTYISRHDKAATA